MKKMKLYLLIVLLGLNTSLLSVFAQDETLVEYKGCPIIEENNGCYLLQDDNGNTEWICKENDENGIIPYDIKCTLDCWNDD